LITDLGRFPEVRVISLQDAAAPSGAETRSEKRGGDYVVRGELQRSGDNIRLYVRLTEATSGEALWSEQYDRAYTDLLSLQDELTREVLNKLRIKVSDAELRRRARPYTRNLQAYEYFLRAQSGLLVRRKPDNDAAREMYLKAIELDPTFARARAGLALTYAADRRNGWTSDGAGALAKAFELATSAQQMDPDTPEIYFALAYVNMERGDLSEATDNLREALRLNPSYADAYALMGGIQTYRGRPQETIPLIGVATRLLPESGYLYFLVLGRAYFFLGDTESASLYLRQALARNPESVESHVYLAATLVRGPTRRGDVGGGADTHAGAGVPRSRMAVQLSDDRCRPARAPDPGTREYRLVGNCASSRRTRRNPSILHCVPGSSEILRETFVR
jgi:tetratricopeptide (TPR) repeat protein